MIDTVVIEKACEADAHNVAAMVGELLHEIMNATSMQAFNFDIDDTAARLKNFLAQEKYTVFIANDKLAGTVGFISMYESYALYAEGAFGTIAELFVRPDCRSQSIGQRLIEQAKTVGNSRGWTRLEVTTPQLPEFNRTLDFYQQEGFEISGGRKLKMAL